MKLLAAFVFVGLACAALASPSLDSKILKTIQAKKSADIIVSFKNANVAGVRGQAKMATLGLSRTQRTQAMFDALNAHADQTQANALRILNKHRSTSVIHSFWITNQIGIKKANLDVIADLLTLNEVSEITEAAVGTLSSPVTTQVLPPGYTHEGEQWGIIAIEAPSVWAEGDRGKGVVLANLDTGVYAEHEALKDGYRQLNGWFDPAEGDSTPTDGHGHGTHTVGTIVGRTNGIGVAPEAEWIHCKGMDRYGFGNDVDFIACGQFFVCPTEADGKTNPRCDLAPKSVSNSWGYIGNFGFFDQVIQAWIDADIAPLFAAGNEGTSCSTLRSPGNSPLSITVGATDSSNKMTYFSSAGPNQNGVLKPDISAPGQDTISAYINGPSSYASMSGTSMATPHVAGLTGLLYNKRASLTADQIRQLLTAGSQPTTPLNKSCGGISDTQYPNNHVGYGRISARASVDELGRL